MEVSILFLGALVGISGCIACGMMLKRNMWKWILVYWWIVSLKNASDFFHSIV